MNTHVMNALTLAPVTSPGNNNYMLSEFGDRMEELGSTKGQGALSRILAVAEAIQVVKTGAVSVDDAGWLWSRFRAGQAAAQGVEFKEEGSIEVQVSKFTQFLKATKLPIDYEDVFERTSTLIKAAKADPDNTLKGSAYDLLLKVTRAQLKKGQCDTALTDEQITAIMAPDEKKEKTEADRLKKNLKDMERTRDGTEEEGGNPSPEIDVAINAIASRLCELASTNNDADLVKLLVKGKYMTLGNVV